MLTFYKLLFFIMILLPFLHAKELKFALVSKEYNSPFFLLSKAGCENAAASLDGVKCLYKGGSEVNPRLQNEIIEELIENEEVDGIAVAVINSDFISKRSLSLAKEAGIPIITYDSDLKLKDKNLRLAYIGSDNFELGVALGNELKAIRPNGGLVCIQSGVKGAINLNLRMQGIRYTLSGENKVISLQNALENNNGWTEYERCPFYSWENKKRAVDQLKNILDNEEDILFVSVGGWAQYYEHYVEEMQPYRVKIQNKELAFVIADATKSQLEFLKKGYSSINIGQNPYEMGKQAIHTLFNIVKGKKYNKVIHTPLTYCSQDNYDVCTKPTDASLTK